MSNIIQIVYQSMINLSEGEVLYGLIDDAPALQSVEEICLWQDSMCWTWIVPRCLCQNLPDLSMDIHLEHRQTWHSAYRNTSRTLRKVIHVRQERRSLRTQRSIWFNSLCVLVKEIFDRFDQMWKYQCIFFLAKGKQRWHTVSSVTIT